MESLPVEGNAPVGRGKWLTLLTVGGLGLALLLTGSWWGAQRFLHYLEASRAVGLLVDNAREISTYKDSQRDSITVSYYPVIEFQTARGEIVRFRGATGSTTPDQRIGMKVTVFYDPTNPTDAQIDAFSQTWLGPVLVMLTGLFVLGATLAAWRMWEEHEAALQAWGHEARYIEGKILENLIINGKSLHTNGVVQEIRAVDDEDGRYYIVVVRATRPGAYRAEEFFSPPLTFKPGPRIIGRHIDIEIDPENAANYALQLDRLMPELVEDTTQQT